MSIRSIQDAHVITGRMRQELDFLSSKNLDFHGRRITNAGNSRAPSDYVTQREIRSLVTEAILNLKSGEIQIIQNITTTVTGVAGTIVFLDVTLTADLTLVAPSYATNTTIIWRFLQDGTGGWRVTWPAEFSTKPAVGLKANKYTYSAFRVLSTGQFEYMYTGVVNGTP